MRVLHLLAPAPFGGLERVVHALSLGQKRKGYDVSVITLLEAGAIEPSIVAELRNAGVPVLPVVYPTRSYRAQRRSILEISRETKPDVLHSHGYLPDVLAASLGSKFHAARVSTVHGFTRGGWRNRFYEWLQRRSYMRFDTVVAVSWKLAQDLASSVSSRGVLYALPNAWAPVETALTRKLARETLRLSDDLFNIGWVGRISHEKGPDVLIEALPALKDLLVHVTMIGDGVEHTKLQHRAQKLQVEEMVSWPGEVPRASRLFRAFDLLVISSRTEGTPIVLFEAIDAGVPIVATSVGGVPDVISLHEALLIRPEDPAALAAAVREVHNAPTEAARRAIQARSRLDKDFAVEPWIESYERIYKDAVATRNSA